MFSASGKLGRSAAAIGTLCSAIVLLRAVPGRSADPNPEPPHPVAHGPNGLVMHFGDSFVDAGLRQALRPRFEAERTRYFSIGKRSWWIATWAYGNELDDIYWGYRPSLYLITLGANDLVYPNPEQRTYLVHDLVKKLRNKPCVWISIPLWEGAPTAFQDMIRRECGPCRYFDSSTVNARITKQHDRRHPDANGGAAWAEAFWEWLQTQRDPSAGYWALKPAPPEEHAPAPSASVASPTSSGSSEIPVQQRAPHP